MIEVIKHGKKKINLVCKVCGCKIKCDLEDLESTISCPDCGNIINDEKNPIIKKCKGDKKVGHSDFDNCSACPYLLR